VSDKQIKFYMNNPCVIIRDINEEFCEIQLNTHFAANIEAENYCTPSECRSPMSYWKTYKTKSIQLFV